MRLSTLLLFMIRYSVGIRIKVMIMMVKLSGHADSVLRYGLT